MVRANYQAASAYCLFLMMPGVPFLLLVSRAREGSVGAGLGAIFFLAGMLAAYRSARWMVMRTVRRGRRTIETLLESISCEITALSVEPTMIERMDTPVEADQLRARLS